MSTFNATKRNRELRDKIYPDNVIATVFSYMPEDDFASHAETIHRKFYEFSQKQEYRDLLKDFAADFIDSYPFPHSPLLDRVIQRLQIGRLLVSLNPDYRLYKMRPEAKASIQKGSATKFSGPDRTKLKKMAEELAGALKKIEEVAAKEVY